MLLCTTRRCLYGASMASMDADRAPPSNRHTMAPLILMNWPPRSIFVALLTSAFPAAFSHGSTTKCTANSIA